MYRLTIAHGQLHMHGGGALHVHATVRYDGDHHALFVKTSKGQLLAPTSWAFVRSHAHGHMHAVVLPCSHVCLLACRSRPLLPGCWPPLPRLTTPWDP